MEATSADALAQLKLEIENREARIGTEHSSYDYGAIVAESPLVVDTRNATKLVMLAVRVAFSA
jgi:hypothetical protein